MKIVAVDDERIALDSLVLKMGRLGDDSLELTTFIDCRQALDHIARYGADIAFLDINMRQMNGLDLAERVAEVCPSCLLVFLTGYSDFMPEAFKIHAFDYLMKPVLSNDLKKTIEDARAHLGKGAGQGDAPSNQGAPTEIEVRTFGPFEVFAGSRLVYFANRRSKELLAYLVDRKGASLSTREACLVFWPDAVIDRGKQSQYQSIVRSLENTLVENGIERMLVRNHGVISLDCSQFKCDLYDFLNGDERTREVFAGEYMSAYPWGEETLAQLTFMV